MRGVPGAGKSTQTKKLADSQGFEQLHVVSADDFFVRRVDKPSPITGRNNSFREYDFDPKLLPWAHSSCMKGFMELINLGVPAIAVDNTNIHRWQYANYEIAAKQNGYEVEIVEVMPETVEELRLCGKRNVHRVPPEVVAKQAMLFEPDTRATVIKMGFEKDL